MAEGLWKGHKAHVICMSVFRRHLWSADDHGAILVWSANGELIANFYAFGKQERITQLIPYHEYMVCAGVRGTMVYICPQTFQPMVTFRNHKNAIDAVAVCEETLWTCSCLRFVMYSGTDQLRVVDEESWGANYTRVMLGVENRVWVFQDNGTIDIRDKNTNSVRSIQGQKHPLCAEYTKGRVWCGYRDGHVAVFTNDGQVNVCVMAHNNSVWDFVAYRDYVISGSCDGAVNVLKLKKAHDKYSLEVVKSIKGMCAIVYAVRVFNGRLCGSGRDTRNVITVCNIALVWETERVLWLGWATRSNVLSMLPRYLMDTIIAYVNHPIMMGIDVYKLPVRAAVAASTTE